MSSERMILFVDDWPTRIEGNLPVDEQLSKATLQSEFANGLSRSLLFPSARQEKYRSRIYSASDTYWLLIFYSREAFIGFTAVFSQRGYSVLHHRTERRSHLLSVFVFFT